MTVTVTKILKVKRRKTGEWEPDQSIAGFREEGTDLVVLDTRGGEQSRYQASYYDSWIVEAIIRVDSQRQDQAWSPSKNRSRGFGSVPVGACLSLC